MTREEWEKAFDLLVEVRKILESKFNPDAFNILTNIGSDAGQTIFHSHIHVIPRYKGKRIIFRKK